VFLFNPFALELDRNRALSPATTWGKLHSRLSGGKKNPPPVFQSRTHGTRELEKVEKYAL